MIPGHASWHWGTKICVFGVQLDGVCGKTTKSSCRLVHVTQNMDWLKYTPEAGTVSLHPEMAYVTHLSSLSCSITLLETSQCLHLQQI